MNTESLYTSDRYVELNPGYHEEDAKWKAGHILRMIRQHSISPNTICEVGCGAGAILAEMEKVFPCATLRGYDIAPRGIELCRKRETARLKFVLGDFTELSAGLCDLALCIDVIEHVPNYQDFLRKLKPKGEYKLFHIPLESSLYKNAVPGRLAVSTKRFGHIHFFSRKTALKALADAGYEVMDSFYTRCGIDCSPTLEARLGRIPVLAVSMISDALAARLFGAHSLMVLTR